MEPFVYILPEAIISQQTNLICEIRKDGLTYFFENDETKKIEGIAVFYFDIVNSDYDTSQALKKLFNEQPLIKKEFKKTSLIYAYDASILIPGKFFNGEKNAEMLEMVYGDLEEGITLTDVVNEKDIYNIYRIPISVHNVLTEQFPTSKFTHQSSLIIKLLPKENNFFQLIFFQNKVTVVLLKHGNLQILKSFSYISPEDVVYNLLNICKEFQVDNISLQLNGMIEKDSLLSNEIHNYFMNVTFNDHIYDNNSFQNSNRFPPHYFNYLFSMASCV